MHFVMMSYLVSDTNRTPQVQLYVAVRIVHNDGLMVLIVMIVGPPTTTAVGPVHVSFVSPWARIILTKDTVESKIFILIYLSN